jgi:hypothetical protein
MKQWNCFFFILFQKINISLFIYACKAHKSSLMRQWVTFKEHEHKTKIQIHYWIFFNRKFFKRLFKKKLSTHGLFFLYHRKYAALYFNQPVDCIYRTVPRACLFDLKLLIHSPKLTFLKHIAAMHNILRQCFISDHVAIVVLVAAWFARSAISNFFALLTIS